MFNKKVLLIVFAVDSGSVWSLTDRVLNESRSNNIQLLTTKNEIEKKKIRETLAKVSIADMGHAVNATAFARRT